MGRPRRVRAAALAGVMGLALLLGSCTAEPPLAIRRTGDTLTFLIGYQCTDPRGYLAQLEVRNIDPRTRDVVSPPLWEFESEQTPPVHPVRSVRLGEVPDGYRVMADNMASQHVYDEVSVAVWVAGNRYNATFNVSKLAEGQVLDAGARRGSEQAFQRRFGCNP